MIQYPTFTKSASIEYLARHQLNVIKKLDEIIFLKLKLRLFLLAKICKITSFCTSGGCISLSKSLLGLCLGHLPNNWTKITPWSQSTENLLIIWRSRTGKYENLIYPFFIGRNWAKMLIEKFPAWKNGETVGLSAEIKPLKFRFGNAVHSKLALEFDQECSIMHFSHALFGQFKYWPQKFMLRSFNGFYNEFIFF